MALEPMFKTSPAKSEFVTRKELIDRKLAATGWRVVEFDPDKPLSCLAKTPDAWPSGAIKPEFSKLPAILPAVGFAYSDYQ